jgi:hypothetical protein
MSSEPLTTSTSADPSAVPASAETGLLIAVLLMVLVGVAAMLLML